MLLRDFKHHITRSVRSGALALVAAGLLAPIWHTPAPALAEAAPDEVARRAEAAPYMAQLLGEINRRREQAGTAPLAYAPDDANGAVGQYLADLTPQMVSAHSCFHGSPPGWDYVSAAGFGAEPRGEVLACPSNDAYWTPARIADGWWNSPMHQRVLYADPNANAVACGTFGPQRGGAAYQTIACVTYRI